MIFLKDCLSLSTLCQRPRSRQALNWTTSAMECHLLSVHLLHKDSESSGFSSSGQSSHNAFQHKTSSLYECMEEARISGWLTFHTRKAGEEE